jgi:hypothetical protein
MKYSDAEIKAYVKRVVDETKSSAKVDTGFLKRSIRGNWFRDIATFREIFYGAYNNNSKLIENAKKIMPNDIPWRVIFVDEDGVETEIEGKTKSGRKISRKSISNENVSTSKIKALIQSIKTNGKEKNDTGKGNGKDNNETP